MRGIFRKNQSKCMTRPIGCGRETHEKYFGHYDYVFHESVSTGIHLDICVIPLRKDHNYYTLVTFGMGAHRMNVPEELTEKKLERAELLINLPPDWKLSEEDWQEEKWYWPIDVLKMDCPHTC